MMKKVCLKVLPLLLTVAVVFGAALAFSSCAKEKEVKDPIFECGDSKMPLYFYEYMLSLKKADLARGKYDVKSDSFWAEKDENGVTNEERYNKEVLEVCKKYFAASVLFDKKGYVLPISVLEDIDMDIEFLLDYDADGDESKFNDIIAEYGVNKEELRECFIIVAKKDAVISEMYGEGGSMISDSLKNQYYKQNYHRFKQILLRKYYFEYETDDWGQKMYFDVETGKPLYDKKNGKFAFDEKESYIRDRFGEIIYFNEDGVPIYDENKGERSAKLDEKGNAIEHEYSAAELAERMSLAEEIAQSVEKNNFSYFESKLEEIAVAEDLGNSYPDGYYVSDIESDNYKNYDYMNDILELLKTMKVGEVKLLVTDFGYHVIMKYELDDGRFADGEYAEWFDSFTGALVGEMFELEISKVLPEVLLNSENIAKAKSIKAVGINYYYYY